jgi:hypothetical protein
MDFPPIECTTIYIPYFTMHEISSTGVSAQDQREERMITVIKRTLLEEQPRAL